MTHATCVARRCFMLFTVNVFCHEAHDGHEASDVNDDGQVDSMSVLKALEFDDSALKKERFNLTDIADEARRLVAEAKAESKKIVDAAVEDARQQCEQGRAEGYEQGRAAGVAEGEKAGHQQALEEARVKFAEESRLTTESLRAILQSFDQVKESLLWQAEQGTVALALAIAEKVVKSPVVATPEAAAANVTAALKLIARATDVTVRVNTQDVESLQRLADAHETTLGRFTSITVMPDNNIEPGGCLVLTEHGEIDAGLETQIKRIADELLMTSRCDAGESDDAVQEVEN